MSSNTDPPAAVEVARVQLAAEGHTPPEVRAILAAGMGAGLTLPYPSDGATVTPLLAPEGTRSLAAAILAAADQLRVILGVCEGAQFIGKQKS